MTVFTLIKSNKRKNEHIQIHTHIYIYIYYKITLIGTSGNKRRRGGSKTKVRTVLIYSGHDPDIHHFERTER